MQAVYVLFWDDDQIKLPHFIAIAGLVCAMFAICIPHLSALGIWLGFSTVLSLVYIVIAFVLSLKDGNVSCLLHICILCLSKFDKFDVNLRTNQRLSMAHVQYQGYCYNLDRDIKNTNCNTKTLIHFVIR